MARLPLASTHFGSGASSVSLNKPSRFDRLKIDRSLIIDLPRDPAAQAVFEAAVAMALKMGAQVVAEGISAAELIEPVSLSGCTHLQGFHISEPVEAGAVAEWFAARVPADLDAPDAEPARRTA